MQFCLRLHQHKSHCFVSFVLPCVLPSLFHHSHTYMTSHIRLDQKPYKVRFWLNRLLNEPTPQLYQHQLQQRHSVESKGVAEHGLKLPRAHTLKCDSVPQILTMYTKQVLKTHLQTTQQVHYCFGFHEQRMSCLQGINKYMTSRTPVLLTAVMGSIESY